MTEQSMIRRADVWIDFAADAITRPYTGWPHREVCELLVRTFGAVGASLSMSTSPEVLISHLWPPEHYGPHEAEIRAWAREHAPTRHPLLRFYIATGEPRCLQVSAVPEQFAGAEVVAEWRELGRRWGGVRDQLAVPLVFGPWGHRAFVLDRDDEFGPAEVELAERVRRLLIGVDRQIHEFDRARRRISVDDWGAVCFTPRETVTLDLLGQGLTAAAIGRRMAISERTVQKHLQRVYVKLGVTDRLAAVRRAESIGVLRPAQMVAPRT
ncbi:helix-turn-helix transcriptional regulator [Actinomycetospora sp.]|jgi:DNA-binding CsgD family transcriptional regulator|uniref:helix-turn-helix transcriptional regulator n=1 Tax=Actinomycetospora sp. TaxID=1872135 RepID=UPI002F42F9AB